MQLLSQKVDSSLKAVETKFSEQVRALLEKYTMKQQQEQRELMATVEEFKAISDASARKF